MALLGGIQRRDLPGQIVVPRPGAELVNAHRHNHQRRTGSTPRSARPRVRTDDAVGVWHIGFEIGWGYVKQVEIVGVPARVSGSCLRLIEGPVSIREM